MPDQRCTEVSFYIVAHADDWQLFMQPNGYRDLVAQGSKVVFIITTAGDAGSDTGYWTAREEGLKSSVRFCLAPLSDISEASGTREFNGHSIHWWSANNVSCYFLRQPDGGLDGHGFSAQNYQSLPKFGAGKISTITTVDNSATYEGWTDFYTTLEMIILFESSTLSKIWINYLNPDTRTNPNDHPDHIATGQAIQEMAVISRVEQALFVGYTVHNYQEKLQKEELFWKAGMFSAYEKAVFDGSGYSTLQEGVGIYLEWCLSRANFITVNS